MNVGQRIRKRRKELNINASELADHVGVSQSTIFRYEKGDIEKVPTTVLEKIAEKLRTSPGALMGWDAAESNYPPIDTNSENDILKSLETQGIIINFSDYDGFEKLSYEEKLDFQKRIEDAVKFELYKRNH